VGSSRRRLNNAEGIVALRMTRHRVRPYVDPLGLAARYEPVLRSLPWGDVDLRNEDLTVVAEGRLRVVYAPFDLIRPAARLVLVGLTPGAYQARLAIGAARDAYAAGADRLGAQRAAKATASFAGPLRSNLTAMLDAIGIPAALGLTSSAGLFDGAGGLVHTTSALRYAVYRDGRNYSGSPSPTRTAILADFLTGLLAPELAAVPDALVIPLGERVTACLGWLAGQNLLDASRVLHGFPHPSGANGHRVADFATQRRRMTMGVRAWFRPSEPRPQLARQ